MTPQPSSEKQAFRIGAQTAPYDPYWVQVQEAILEQAAVLGVTLVSVELPDQTASLTDEEQDRIIQELVTQDLDAFICINLPNSLIERILSAGLPAIYLDESEIKHPLFVSSYGLYDAARIIGRFLADKLLGPSRVLCVGGNPFVKGDPSNSRITGLQEELRAFPHISVEYTSSPWIYEPALAHLQGSLSAFKTPFDAVFGLSDSLALAGRDACREHGLLKPETLIVGVNADPVALAAIDEGSMHATVNIHAATYGHLAVQLACQASRHELLPELICYELSLVTRENLDQTARQKLIDIANLPNRLVGVHRQQEQNRLAQLEISTAINRRVGALLNRQQLTQEIADLIRANYGYDRVYFCAWSESQKSFLLEGAEQTLLPYEQAGLFTEAVQRQEPIFIPDTQSSSTYPPDPRFPETRSRVILPVRMGTHLLGILDLHSYHRTVHLHLELIGLQSLADQLGIAVSNADLYAEALQARAEAEKANQLKTRLLANVSHELRTPTNTILGYSQMMLSSPNPYHAEFPANVRHDLENIFKSGEHLTRLINDLLDLSRAEIGELNIFPETIATRAFLEELYSSIVETVPLPDEVHWHLSIPERLPVILADPVRLRQILSNLLVNASKFTSSGEIRLGCEVELPYLHLWVKDTGTGISRNFQERIFEPFVTADSASKKRQGIGLGLSITRHLVALHGGKMVLQSIPGKGSTFNVYLPLPALSGSAVPVQQITQPVLLILSSSRKSLAALNEIHIRMGWEIRTITPSEDFEKLLKECQPAAFAWDLETVALDEWRLVERIYHHPRLNQLPFILYGNFSGDLSGLTSLLAKPVNGKTLIETINTLKPATSSGPILIVEDDAETRAYYQKLLTEAMPESPLIMAENGEQALAILEKEVPGVVLLDLVMPNVDGFTVLERMRANHLTRQVPVMVLSGHSLTMEDVLRLDYARVTFHSKGLLSPEEAIASLQQALSGQIVLPQPTSTLVKRVLAYFHQNYQTPLTRLEIAGMMGVSEDYLSRIFRKEMGISPWECLNRHRIQKAKELLSTSQESITAIAGQVGFEDSAYFSRVFRQYTGQSPKSYRLDQ
jgi:signal transduction histidine kinase/AraC-like DNA-binding protein/ABC-type sugar transport system substrate-binding protein